MKSAIGFNVEYFEIENRARVGVYEWMGKSFETPALIACSKKGCIQGSMSNVIEELEEPRIISLNLRDLITDLDVLDAYKKGACGFMNLNNKVVFLTYQDPANFDSKPICGGELNLNTPGGKKRLSLPDFFGLQKSLQADIYCSLSFDIPFHVNEKSHKRCVDFTLKWLEEIASSRVESENDTISGSLFAVIQGGQSHRQRNRCIDGVLNLIESHVDSGKPSPIHGFVLGGFGLGEFPGDRNDHVKSTLERLPRHLPTCLPLIYLPQDILDAVSHGIDLFFNDYPNKLAQTGYALTFPYSKQQLENTTFIPPPNFHQYKINLNDHEYAFDTDPVLQYCLCYTCKRHNRAYIHHLINTHEMLSNTLLFIHNAHHYYQFFLEIRVCIKNGQFSAYKHLMSKMLAFAN